MALTKAFGNIEGRGNGLALMQADDLGRGKTGDAGHRCVLQTRLVDVTIEVSISTGDELNRVETTGHLRNRPAVRLPCPARHN